MKSSGILKSAVFEVDKDHTLRVYEILRRMQKEIIDSSILPGGCHLYIPGYLDEPGVVQIFSVRAWVEAGPCSWWRKVTGRIPVIHKIRFEFASKVYTP